MKKIIFLLLLLILSFNAAAEAVSSETISLKANRISPDSLLWYLDTFLEKISLSFTSDPQAKIIKSLSYADERLLEMRNLEDKGDKEALKKAEDNYKDLISETEKNIGLLEDLSSITGLAAVIEAHSKNSASLGLVKAQEIMSGGAAYPDDKENKGILAALQKKKDAIKENKGAGSEEIKKLEQALQKLKEEIKKDKETAQKAQEENQDPVQKYKKELAKKLFPKDRKGNYDLDNSEMLYFLKEMYLLSSGLSEEQFEQLMEDAKGPVNEIEPVYGNVGGNPAVLGQLFTILKSDPKGELSFVPINLAGNICPEGEEPDQSKLPKGFKFAEGCFDSDGGKDIYVKGTTTKKSKSYTDICMVELAKDAVSKAFFKDVLSENSCDKFQLSKWVKCEFGCQDGRCLKEKEPPKIAEVKFSQCQDSDGGLNYDKKGIVVKGLQESKDQCVTVVDEATNSKVTVLKEYYCQDNEVAEKIYKGCEDGCSDGRCKSEIVNISNQAVLPADDEKVKEADGEAGGEASEDNENKENVGSFFDVNTDLCNDTDGGKDYGEKGTVTLGDESKIDACVFSRSSESFSLNEYFCDGNAIASEQHACENGCEEGQCKVALKVTPGMFG